MQLEFYGGAGEVTGSCHILTVGGRRLLLDCGMIQGGDRPRTSAIAPISRSTRRSVDAVILSHAHIDHCGRLPLLRKRGFRGPIYTNPACRDLVRILLADSAHDAGARRRAGEPQARARAGGADRSSRSTRSTTPTDVLQQVRAVPYGRPIEVLPGVELVFRDAGHILGSASVWLHAARGRARAAPRIQRRPRPVRHADPARPRAGARGRPAAHGEHLRRRGCTASAPTPSTEFGAHPARRAGATAATC